MRVDIHGHIGSLGDRTFSLDGARRYLDACGVDRLLVSNLDAASVGPGARDLDEPDANVATLEACRQEPRLTAVYWVRPGRVDSNVHALAGALETEPFSGALFSPVRNDFAADDKRLDRYVQAVGKLNRVALFETARLENARPTRVYLIARRHPRVAVVLLNAGGDTHWPEAVDAVRRSIERSDARLYLATTRASAAEVAAAVEDLGARCVLFGSDATVHGEQHAARVQLQLDQLQAALAPAEFARVAGENAQELFRLPATP